jgi:hypothetical protein
MKPPCIKTGSKPRPGIDQASSRVPLNPTGTQGKQQDTTAINKPSDARPARRRFDDTTDKPGGDKSGQDGNNDDTGGRPKGCPNGQALASNKRGCLCENGQVPNRGICDSNPPGKGKQGQWRLG